MIKISKTSGGACHYQLWHHHPCQCFSFMILAILGPHGPARGTKTAVFAVLVGIPSNSLLASPFLTIGFVHMLTCTLQDTCTYCTLQGTQQRCHTLGLTTSQILLCAYLAAKRVLAQNSMCGVQCLMPGNPCSV